MKLSWVVVVMGLLSASCIGETNFTFQGRIPDGGEAWGDVEVRTVDGTGDAHDILDVHDTRNVPDGADVPGLGDVPDTNDVPDSVDAPETGDIPDASDVSDVADSGDAADIGDAHDAGDLPGEVCSPQCDGKECGDDGCGGTCGQCDDGNPCNGEETCLDGECAEGTLVTCDDSNPCTGDWCDPADGLCDFLATEDGDEVACDDGNPCTLEQCKSGACDNPLAPLAELVEQIANGQCLCKTDEDCAGLNDDDLCNGSLYCAADPEGKVPAGILVCQVDPATIKEGTYDDGLWCNGLETCDPATGEKVDGIPPLLDDGVECTVDTCDEDNDIPVHSPDDSACDDNDACNGAETCDAVGGCLEGTPLVCDDGNACSDNQCDPAAGCQYPPIDCDDASLCTNDGCDGLTGCFHNPVSCDDGVLCTTSSCDPVQGCQHTPVDALCDDGKWCTTESCDAVLGCVYTPDHVYCDDGKFCTEDTCVPFIGCKHSVAALDGTTCDDGDPCTVSDMCNGGACKGSAFSPDPGEDPCVAVADKGVCKGKVKAECKALGGKASWSCDYGAAVGYEAKEVSCDFLDNDCDGAVDPGCDGDGDLVWDEKDNCPLTANRAQADFDKDGLGDACDPCPLDATNACAALLMAWWKLDDQAPNVIADSSGYGLNGAGANGVSVGKAGRVGTAAEFSGNDGDMVSVPAGKIPAAFKTIGQVTVEAYVKPSVASLGAERYILDASYHSFALSIDADGFLKCRWFPAGKAVVSLLSKNKVVDGKWHRVACIRHIETDLTPKVAVFVDGMVDNAVVDANAGTGLTAVTSIALGSSLDQTGAFLGLLDEVKISFVPAIDHAADFDEDGILDVVDNCPGTPNHGQADGNLDGVGDACTVFASAACLDGSQCNDGNACTADSCAGNTCSNMAVGDGTPCNDQDLFTVNDKCSAGVCTGSPQNLVVSFDQTLQPGHHFFKDVTVKSGKTLTCKGDTTTYYGMGCIIHAQNVTVEQTAKISADGEGFPLLVGPGIGPGVYCDYAPHLMGGNHAGSAIPKALPYGSISAPVALGSGSCWDDKAGTCVGQGGSGGGAVALFVDSTIANAGSILANGQKVNDAPGSGGSILLSSQVFTGEGIVAANGGPSGKCSWTQSPASGGRIAIYAAEKTFSGSVTAVCGTGVATPGCDGTIYIAP